MNFMVGHGGRTVEVRLSWRGNPRWIGAYPPGVEQMEVEQEMIEKVGKAVIATLANIPRIVERRQRENLHLGADDGYPELQQHGVQ